MSLTVDHTDCYCIGSQHPPCAWCTGHMRTCPYPDDECWCDETGEVMRGYEPYSKKIVKRENGLISVRDNQSDDWDFEITTYYECSLRSGRLAIVLEGEYEGQPFTVEGVGPTAVFGTNGVAHRAECVVGISQTNPMPDFDTPDDAEAWMRKTFEEDWEPQIGSPVWVDHHLEPRLQPDFFSGDHIRRDVTVETKPLTWIQYPAIVTKTGLTQELQNPGPGEAFWTVQFLTPDGLCDHEHSIRRGVLHRRGPHDPLGDLEPLQDGGCRITN